ncbi:hypothetical protein Gogos_019932 [Gossypium gossypioides]|uniref:Uncharacterized protein n=1 Tax=Gossypium gossypioides TaxID=34282 RepID=A0A7J9D3H5_GOSGO|nr:hypothetical protein [Gossypium gossypioides]
MDYSKNDWQPPIINSQRRQRTLDKKIDKCYKGLSYYQTQTGIDLMTKAQYLLHQEIYKLWIDGRRILVYDTGNIKNDKDEESLRLLKKIAEMEIEDFPSHIIEEIKSKWETWNSSPRLSLNSLHLDDIEEMNLDNIQEG